MVDGDVVKAPQLTAYATSSTFTGTEKPYD
jgi:hypothetical protein